MSNRSLRHGIHTVLESYRKGESTLQELKAVTEIKGPAFEMMPYSMIKEIDGIEEKLTMAQFDSVDGFEPKLDEAISSLELWLDAVPREKG